MFRRPFFRAYGFWHWGEGLQTVLFTWYMTFHAGLSASEIGFYQALVLSPFLVFTIAGGMLTDRIGAGVSYVGSTTLFGLLLFGYGVLDHAMGFVPVLFFVYCLAAGVVSAVSNPAIDTFIPEAGPGTAYENGVLAATAHNLAKLSGTITGLLLPMLAAFGGFVVNGVLMLLSVAFLRKHLRQNSEQLQVHAAGEGPPWSRVWQHYRACPENFDILLSSAMLGLLIVPTGYILWPLTLRERFPEYGDLIALVNIASWIGAISATAMAGRYSRRILKPGLVSLVVWGGYAVMLTTLTLVGSFAALCLVVMVLGSVKVGKAMVYGKYIHNCPSRARGVLISVEQTAFWGLATLGTFAMGASVDLIGLDTTILTTALLVLVFVAVLTLRGRLLRLSLA
ncbi:Major Facilitator Superfamily protein [Falsiruegeria litorea R37]|uniref:Major Facilitator Superfamily protein n=1 Tax=Falsiruegeria litorea R37 TaxID=1200284 RepID=A0A1Y5TLU9_9RHOB|nr:MFS transporter [Falsiruegeria litorea]SLN66958.1 Major Facilitator Superfamily protein [Falsiruegeria litorea R37]